MGDMDQGIKQLLQLHPQDLLTVAFPDADPLYLGPVETDVAMAPQLITDTLQRARVYGEECIIDWEAEAYPSAEMPRRCFEYGARTDTLHGLPILSLVLLLQPKGNAPSSPYIRKIGPITVATWHFQNIEVYKLKGRDILKDGLIGLLPLVPFMADRSLEIIEEAAGMIKDRVPDKEDFENLEALLGVFGAKFFDATSVKAIMGRFKVSLDIMGDSPLLQELFDLRELKVRREDIRLILENRFGSLNADLIHAIDTAELATLRALFQQTLTATLDEIRAKLMHAPTATSETVES